MSPGLLDTRGRAVHGRIWSSGLQRRDAAWGPVRYSSAASKYWAGPVRYSSAAPKYWAGPVQYYGAALKYWAGPVQYYGATPKY